MKSTQFPWITLSIGLITALALMWSGPINPASRFQISQPTAMLLVSLGGLSTVAGVFVAIKRIRQQDRSSKLATIAGGNALLAVNLIYMGYRLWSLGGTGL